MTGSSENRRRARRPPLRDRMRGIVSTFRNVSTESDQAQSLSRATRGASPGRAVRGRSLRESPLWATAKETLAWFDHFLGPPATK